MSARAVVAVLAGVLLAGCGGAGPSSPPPPTKTDVAPGTTLRIVKVKGTDLRCAVLIGPDDTYASRAVALDCDWPRDGEQRG